MQMTMPGTGELIKSGRAFVAEQWGLIILAAVGAPILLSILSKILEKALEHSALSFGAHIGIFALSLIISLGAKKITLDLVDGKDAQLGDLFSQSQLFWKFLLATVVYAVVLVVGFILLIIPGIYFSLKYGFFRVYPCRSSGAFRDGEFVRECPIDRGHQVAIIRLLARSYRYQYFGSHRFRHRTSLHAAGEYHGVYGAVSVTYENRFGHGARSVVGGCFCTDGVGRCSPRRSSCCRVTSLFREPVIDEGIQIETVVDAVLS